MERVVRSLPDSWEGEAALACEEQFYRLKPGLVETRELIRDIAVQIDQALAVVQELDATLALKLR